MIIRGEITHTIKMADYESLKITWSAEADTKDYDQDHEDTVVAIQQALDRGTKTDLTKAYGSQDPYVSSYLSNWVTGEERA
jgi:hypothetical protein